MKSFHFPVLAKKLQTDGKAWEEFLNVDSMYGGVYRLDAGDIDRQQPHAHDEVYYIVSGKATLVVEEKRFDAKPGAILFVRREIAHRFVEIEEPLEVLVFFSKQT